VFVDCDPSAHGEVVAIRNAGKSLRTYDLQGCSLYTNFEPCPMCTAAIWWSRFVLFLMELGMERIIMLVAMLMDANVVRYKSLHAQQ